MKTLFLSIIFTSVFFLIIDVIWLSFSVKSFYRPNLGNLILDKPIMWAAVLFYLVYVIGLSILVLQPAIDENSIFKAFFTGIVFGLAAYGTYNLTNMAVLKGWSPYVVFVDMFWGGFLTAFSSALGIFIAKKIIT